MAHIIPKRKSALILMISTAVLWSTAGVFTRHLDTQNGFEMNFWRGLFTALFVFVVLIFQYGKNLYPTFAKTGKTGVLSGILWGIMFSGFMIALSLTTVANTHLIDSLTPFLTAVLAWIMLKQKTPMRTCLAIIVASVGVVWMFWGNAVGGGEHLLGMTVALLVPFSFSLNFVLLKKSGRDVDFIPTVFLGAVFSVLCMLPFVFPFQSTWRDILILAFLGVFQSGIPCVFLVIASRTLSPPEISLIAMLEIVLGPFWAWLGAGEIPSISTVIGGIFILSALLWNELMGIYREKYLDKNNGIFP